MTGSSLVRAGVAVVVLLVLGSPGESDLVRPVGAYIFYHTRPLSKKCRMLAPLIAPTTLRYRQKMPAWKNVEGAVKSRVTLIWYRNRGTWGNSDKMREKAEV